jgi:hypothetical protein
MKKDFILVRIFILYIIRVLSYKIFLNDWRSCLQGMRHIEQ